MKPQSPQASRTSTERFSTTDRHTVS